MEDEILTIKEVANHLKIKEKTAYALAAKGEIPNFKVGVVGVLVKKILNSGLKDKKRHRNKK